MEQVTADVIRRYMVSMETEGHNAGGILLHYRAIKAFSRFWQEETDGEYRDPFRKVRPPKVVVKPIPGIPVEDVMKMVDCASGQQQIRDIALLLTLLDTGARMTEFLSMNVGDLDLEEGKINIIKGKGYKARRVFIGKRCRRALRRYLKERKRLRHEDPLWVNDEGDRLSETALRSVMRRRSIDAKLGYEPGIHDFRRAFALAMQRNGADVITISRQMGHSSLEVLKRYLDQDEEDLRKSHERCSPVDNS
jgi:site-specific recombinase XerD